MRQLAKLVITTSVCLGGCLSGSRVGYQSSQALAVQEGTPQSERMWESAEQVLREHRFRLDRVDRAAGVITTFPVGSQHWFEFWRHDVHTRSDWVEATINPVRRWAEVTFAPEDGRWPRIEVIVQKQRLSAPDRQFNNSAAAYQFFADSLPTTAGEMKPALAGEAWLDLGRDPAMEERLLREITARATALSHEATEHGATETSSHEEEDSRTGLENRREG